MAITENVRKALADATPLYAAAGTVDLAAAKLREVPPLLEKLREEAPERLGKVRAADPKVVQERVAQQAKDVQARLTEVIGGVELDLRKLRDNAQDFALQQVGRAAEYAVKAGETYNGLVDRGRGAVKTWRGEAADHVEDLAVVIEAPAPSKSSAEPAQPVRKPATAKRTTPKKTTPAKPAE
ncbi:hypothetical protein [Streptomyces sp. ICBB 8177]|uniref:hypothetical protein n=1 Tax=Streptomyces sp. ICBB 8177 TaxID=563922 RepID=UPI000D68225B|nr:hypothetical protein [Streptomyces sp. ICBB 8177]PWI45814.1 hypothetical protein CK485_01185 [Streptomyces sp. ICBB 8177]